jgi:hypothetical protein
MDERDLRLEQGNHQAHVAIMRWPDEAPLIKVGAFGPADAVCPSALLFIVEMDVPTARNFARKLLAACDAIDGAHDGLAEAPRQAP